MPPHPPPLPRLNDAIILGSNCPNEQVGWIYHVSLMSSQGPVNDADGGEHAQPGARDHQEVPSRGTAHI